MDNRLFSIMTTLEVKGVHRGYLSDREIQAIYADWAKYGITAKIVRVGSDAEVRNS